MYRPNTVRHNDSEHIALHLAVLVMVPVAFVGAIFFLSLIESIVRAANG